jgi:glycosyltransferase involved in cell wall biosynthesis
MRVLHVVTAFPRTESDVITPWLVETLKRLKAQGVDVEVFTSSYKGLGDQVLFGIPIHRFRYFPKRWEDFTHDETAPDRMRKGLRYKLEAVAYVVSGQAAIARLCRRQRYDIVHVHWPFPHALFGSAARRAGKCKVISSFYGVELRWVKSRLPIFKPFVRWAIRSADAVTAISNHTAGEIQELEPRDVTVIPFGASLEQTNVEPRSLTPDPGPLTILFVGRLVERKGVKYLIEALKLVREKFDARLVIVGNGSERANLEAQARELGLNDAVTFAGFVSSPDKERLYRECSMFVLPAARDAKGDVEGLGTVLLEAMMHHKPVIASESGGITDIVKHEQTGLLVKERDVRSLADAILRVLGDRQLSNKLAEQGYQHAVHSFGWESIVASLVKLYGEVDGSRT